MAQETVGKKIIATSSAQNLPVSAGHTGAAVQSNIEGVRKYSGKDSIGKNSQKQN